MKAKLPGGTLRDVNLGQVTPSLEGQDTPEVGFNGELKDEEQSDNTSNAGFGSDAGDLSIGRSCPSRADPSEVSLKDSGTHK